MFFAAAKRGVKAPRLPRNSPQLHHKKPQLARPFSQKPLQKHLFTTP
jgi:hypothetical protein